MHHSPAQPAAPARLTAVVRRLALPAGVLLCAAVGAALPEFAHASSFRPELAIPIPDLTFSDVQRDSAGYINVPWIAQYISAILRYSVGLAALLASVMFVVGGFQVLTGGTSDRVGKGKERVKNALIGVVLTLLSYTLLRTVNPDLVNPDALRIRTAETSRAFPGKFAASDIETGSLPVILSPQDTNPVRTRIAPVSECARKDINQATRDAAIAAEKKTRIPAAVLLGQWSVESNNGVACIGNDDGTKKFNCWGAKCVSNGKYAGNDVPITEGGTRPVCPPGCVSRKTTEGSKSGARVPYYSCFQVYDTWDEAVVQHAKTVQKRNWEEYIDNPVGFARFIQSIGYATDPNYSAAVINRMKANCLIEPI